MLLFNTIPRKEFIVQLLILDYIHLRTTNPVLICCKIATCLCVLQVIRHSRGSLVYCKCLMAYKIVKLLIDSGYQQCITLTHGMYLVHTVLPRIMARVFISFQQLFTPAIKRDWRLFISWSSESKFFGLWILMVAGNTHAADPVDFVHHERDSVVRSHCFYKST